MEPMTLLERKPYTLRAIETGYMVHGRPEQLDHVQAVYEAMSQDIVCESVTGDNSADPDSLSEAERYLLCCLLDGPTSKRDWNAPKTQAERDSERVLTAMSDESTDDKIARLMRELGLSV